MLASYHYLEINPAGTAVARLETSEPIDAAHMILMPEARPDLLGAQYDAVASAVAGEPVFVPAEPLPDPTAWLIDIGPFFDRFGAAKMAVLTSPDPGVRAILSDLQVRKWIDLQREDVFLGLQYVGTEVPAVTAELQETILTTPVAPTENLALRKLYFS